MTRTLTLLSLAFAAAGCIARAAPEDFADDADAERLADLEAYRQDAEAPPEPRKMGPVCDDGTVEWLRAPGVTSCAAPCRSDNDCLGYATGDERCRLMQPDDVRNLDPVFVDKELAAELDAFATEERAAIAIDDGVLNDDGTLTVEPDCDENCKPLDVPAPSTSAAPRLCDEFWDIDPWILAGTTPEPSELD